MAIWLGVSWRTASLRTGLDLERLYDRPSGYATWTASHRQASTPRPPHVMFLTRPSPRLAIFIACYVARAGEGLGTRLSIVYDCSNNCKYANSYNIVIMPYKRRCMLEPSNNRSILQIYQRPQNLQLRTTP